jgi:hypothetical protein
MLPVAPPIFEFLLENALTAIIIVVYIFYEIHFGRIGRSMDKVESIIIAVIALARETPGVDDEKVEDLLNGSTPDGLRRGDPDSEAD